MSPGEGMDAIIQSALIHGELRRALIASAIVIVLVLAISAAQDFGYQRLARRLALWLIALIVMFSIASLVMIFFLFTASAQQRQQDTPSIRLIATLCRLSFPADCHDEIVTISISMSECMIAVRDDLGQWSQQFPAYYVAGWKCQIGAKAQEWEA